MWPLPGLSFKHDRWTAARNGKLTILLKLCHAASVGAVFGSQFLMWIGKLSPHAHLRVTKLK